MDSKQSLAMLTSKITIGETTRVVGPGSVIDLVSLEVSEGGLYTLRRIERNTGLGSPVSVVSVEKKGTRLWADECTDEPQGPALIQSDPERRITAILPLELEQIVLGFGVLSFLLL